MKVTLTEKFWNGSKWIAAGKTIEVTSKLAKELLDQQRNRKRKAAAKAVEEEE